MRTRRDPRTKEDFLDRILRYDFDGDIRAIGSEPARIERTAANTLRLTFPATGTTYEISVHRPRDEAPRSAAQAPRRAAEERSFSNDEEWSVSPEDTTGDRPARRSRRPQADPSPS